MYYNTASHILFLIFFHGIEKYISGITGCSSLAISPLIAEIPEDKLYTFYLQIKKPSNKQYTIIISTSHKKIFTAVKEYLYTNFSNIVLRLQMLSKKKLDIILKNSIELEYSTVPVMTLSVIAYVRYNMHDPGECLKVYFPIDFFTLFKIRTQQIDMKAIPIYCEQQLIQFFNDPYNLFPSLNILLETMEDDECQRLVYSLLNENILTPYHLYLLTRAFPQHSLKIKHNISSNLISDILAIGKSVKTITSRDLYEAIYAFEEILFLRLRNKPYFHYGTFIEQIHNMLHHLSILALFNKKPFDIWFTEMQQEGLLYKVLSQCHDKIIASAFSHHPLLFKHLANFFSTRRMKSLQLYSNQQFDTDTIALSQYEIIQLYLNNMTKFKNLYQLPFNKLLKRIIEPNSMYYVLFEVGWFTVATALKQLPEKLMMDAIQTFPRGARDCIIDVYNGTLNPNILHDEIQIKKARNVIISTIIKLYCKNIIRLFV